MRGVFVLGLAASFLWTAPASAHQIKAGSLVIVHPWVKLPASGDVMAGYMSIINNGAADDTLIAVSAEGAPDVKLYDVKKADGASNMIPVPEGVVIPAGKTVDFKPKSLHVMLMGATSLPMDGTEITGSLTFARQGKVEIEYEVVGGDGMN